MISKKEIILALALIAAFFALMFYLLSCVAERKAECNKNGGVLVRSAVAGYDCVQSIY